jgi:hypothetical protein
MVAAAITIISCVASKSSSHTWSKKKLPAPSLGSHVILNLKRHEKVASPRSRKSPADPRSPSRRSSRGEATCRRVTYSSEVRNVSDVRNFVDPNWEPSERPLVANYLVRDTHASIGWPGFHTSNSASSTMAARSDRRQVRRARSPNSPIDPAASRKKQLLPNIHTIQHREAVPGPCLFHPRCMSTPPRRVAATASRRSQLLPPVYMGETGCTGWRRRK